MTNTSQNMGKMMTRIKIKTIKIHNFLSFQDEEWDFDNTSKLVLIKGINKDTCTDSETTSNGSGKSAWGHALMFGLFGQLTGKMHNANLKNKYSSGVNEDGYKMSVDIEVDTIVSSSETRHWRILRGFQKTAAIALQLFTMGDDGKWQDISKSSSANTQKFIEDSVLMMNLEMYQRLVMLSIDDKYNFFKLNAGQKRDFVETLFDTSVYSNMYKNMTDDMKSKNLVVQNLKAEQVKLAKTKELCEDEIERYKAGVQDQINATSKEKKELEAGIKAFEPKFLEIEQHRESVQEDLEKVRASRAKVSDALKSCKDTITSARMEINNFNTTISHHEREINKHKEVLGMICDDCRGVVNKFYSLDVYRKEIDDLRGKMDGQNAVIEATNAKIAKINELDARLKTDETSKMGELGDIQVDERNLQFQKSQMESSLRKVERQISDLVESLDNQNKIPSYSVYQKTLSDIDAVDFGLKDELMNMCLLKIGSEIVSPESIKRNIISKVVSSINTMINANLSELSVGFTCNLTSDMNDYEIQSDGGELDFSLLSLGEQMKLIISSQLAFRKFLLSRFNVCMNVMIIDEVVDRALDSVSIKKLLEMLLQISQKENMSISIISHRREVEEMFNELSDTQTMIVQKENNISRILRD